MPELLTLLGFGSEGWGASLLTAAAVTVAVAFCGFAVGGVIGSLVAWARIRGGRGLRALADTYTTVLRGIPDLLVIYLFYFGGSMLLTWIGGLFGPGGFIDVPPFAAGAAAIGVVSAAYQAEVYRGAFRALARGEIEAGRSVGMSNLLLFRRIIAPQVIRHALPGIGNIWQMVLKESALISVTGLVEVLRQSQIAAGSTQRPFEFYSAAGVIFLLITWGSQLCFSHLEARFNSGRRGEAI
jgi:octopine/nopaline transport system permease protein